MRTVQKRILVTGGAGFLGSHLCDRLCAQGHDVLCVDNYFTGRKDNVAQLLREPYLLAAATDHRAATRDRWSARDLGDMAFVLRAACEATDEATRLFAAEGVRPRAVLRSADEERCAAAVLAGLGVCLMPRSLLRPGMAAAEVREVGLERRVMLAWRTDADQEIASALREAASGDDRLAFAR